MEWRREEREERRLDMLMGVCYSGRIGEWGGIGSMLGRVRRVVFIVLCVDDAGVEGWRERKRGLER